jgi:uncharacterized membrane protein
MWVLFYKTYPNSNLATFVSALGSFVALIVALTPAILLFIEFEKYNNTFLSILPFIIAIVLYVIVMHFRNKLTDYIANKARR